MCSHSTEFMLLPLVSRARNQFCSTQTLHICTVKKNKNNIRKIKKKVENIIIIYFLFGAIKCNLLGSIDSLFCNNLRLVLRTQEVDAGLGSCK